jgi:hypothetical protein
MNEGVDEDWGWIDWLLLTTTTTMMMMMMMVPCVIYCGRENLWALLALSPFENRRRIEVKMGGETAKLRL